MAEDFTSEPAFIEVPVIDVDFGFSTGAVKSFTLNLSSGDSLTKHPTRTEIVVHDPGGEETINIYREALAWDSVRHRIMRIPVEGPVLDPQAEVALPGPLSSTNSEDEPFPGSSR